MITLEEDLLEILDNMGLVYQRYSHPAVFTCAQAEKDHINIRGISTKNLFVRDRSGRFFLIMTDCKKRLDLKALAAMIGAKERLIFGSPDELMQHLGLTPGAVTVLALINDESGSIRLVVDSEIWNGDQFLCHPLVNTATLAIPRAEMLRFLEMIHHSPQVVGIPEG